MAGIGRSDIISHRQNYDAVIVGASLAGCAAAIRRLLREDGAFRGIVVRDRHGKETTLRGRLIVGADGRDSRTAELSGVATKTLPHGRFAYGAYFEGAPPADAPDSSLWFLDPDIGAAFPTDSDLVFYVAMPTKDHLAEFKHDLEGAFVSFVAGLPDAPPIRRIGPPRALATILPRAIAVSRRSRGRG